MRASRMFSYYLIQRVDCSLNHRLKTMVKLLLLSFCLRIQSSRFREVDTFLVQRFDLSLVEPKLKNIGWNWRSLRLSFAFLRVLRIFFISLYHHKISFLTFIDHAVIMHGHNRMSGDYNKNWGKKYETKLRDSRSFQLISLWNLNLKMCSRW